MRARLLLTCLAALGLPSAAGAQVYSYPTPPPAVTAASADWQIQGEPIFYAGGFYYPTGATIFFDGNVMVRTGVYRGVPLYEDATRLPYTVVFVPIGRNLMRPYEPVALGPPPFPVQGELVPEYPPPVGMTGAPVEPPFVPESREAPARPPNLTITSVPPPTSNAGIFVDYAGSRWYHAGPAVLFDPIRFRAVGTYHGFTVYAEANDPDRIFIPVVPGGALSQYKR